MAGPSFGHRSLANSAGRAGDIPMEALRGFLKETRKKLELLFYRSSSQAIPPRNPVDVPAVSFNVDDVPVSDLSSEGYQHAVQINGLNRGKIGQLENWLSQNCSFEDSGQRGEQCNLDCEALEAANLGSFGDSKTGDSARSLVEDIKKALDLWSARYVRIVQGRPVSRREEAEAGAARILKVRSHAPITDAEVLSQLELDEDEDIPVLNLPLRRKGRALSQALTAPEKTVCLVQSNEERRHLSQDEQSKAQDGHLTPLFNKRTLVNQAATGHEPSIEGKRKLQAAFPESTEVDCSQQSIQSDHAQFDVGSTNAAELKYGSLDQKQNNLAITPYKNEDLRVEVVESPDWLPKGWITELKMRCSGTSAGSRDRYFFDPVSKRRFRSKKEVFSFLATGKLGRYKSKVKAKPTESTPGTEHTSPGQAVDINEAKTSSKGDSSDASTIVSESVAAPVSIPPMAASPPGVFMPYRSGQPSEWLMHESLGSLPVPVLDRFRYAEYNAKSNSNRGPAPWQLVFTNSEGSRKPFIDVFGKLGESSRDGQTVQFSSGEARISETASKRYRKLSKRN